VGSGSPALSLAPNLKRCHFAYNPAISWIKGGLSMTLKYNVRQTNDVAILDLSGRLSLGEALAFGPGSGVVLSETVRELTKKGQKKILLNLREVGYVDSSGVGQLVGALTTARNQGGDVKLLKPSVHVLDLLKTTRLDAVFDIQQDEAAAIQSFSKSAGVTA
jgi:anti-sigma B factor antagonist